MENFDPYNESVQTPIPGLPYSNEAPLLRRGTSDPFNLYGSDYTETRLPETYVPPLYIEENDGVTTSTTPTTPIVVTPGPPDDSVEAIGVETLPSYKEKKSGDEPKKSPDLTPSSSVGTSPIRQEVSIYEGATPHRSYAFPLFKFSTFKILSLIRMLAQAPEAGKTEGENLKRLVKINRATAVQKYSLVYLICNNIVTPPEEEDARMYILRLIADAASDAGYGSPESYYLQGQLYEYSLLGHSYDINMASQKYRIAAGLGVIEAQEKVVELCSHLYNVEVELESAFRCAGLLSFYHLKTDPTKCQYYVQKQSKILRILLAKTKKKENLKKAPYVGVPYVPINIAQQTGGYGVTQASTKAPKRLASSDRPDPTHRRIG